jgi:hypothetical protein
MSGGRPTDYTLDLADKICERLAAGESMRSVSRDEEMPASATMFRWLREKPEFKEQYEVAKEECADMYAEEIIEIADDSANDYIDVTDENGATGATRLNSEHVQRSRLRVDSRKWVASKLKPKKYGDKIQQEFTGKVDYSDVSEQEIDNKLQALLDATSSTKQEAED